MNPVGHAHAVAACLYECIERMHVCMDGMIDMQANTISISMDPSE